MPKWATYSYTMVEAVKDLEWLLDTNPMDAEEHGLYRLASGVSSPKHETFEIYVLSTTEDTLYVPTGFTQ